MSIPLLHGPDHVLVGDTLQLHFARSVQIMRPATLLANLIIIAPIIH